MSTGAHASPSLVAESAKLFRRVIRLDPAVVDSPRTSRVFVALGFLAVTLFCFLPLTLHPGDVLVGTVRNGLNDVTGYYIGQRDFPRLCLSRFQQLPFWNPTTCGGVPYLGNPQGAFFYPPNWLFWIFGASGTISWVMAGHHLVAGIGAYGLGRKLGLSRLGAFCGGVAYLASPVLLARTSEGHLGTLGAVTWAPWAFWMYERYHQGERKRGLGLACVLALSMLAGHIQEAYYLVFALTLVCLYDAARMARRGESDPAGQMVLRWPVVGLATAGLAMAELIPMAIFARNSARTSGLFAGISVQSSAGPASFLQVFNPFALGTPQQYQGPGTYFWETLCHFGVVPTVLAVVGLFVALYMKRPFGRLAVVGVVGFLFALGGNTPLYPLLHKIVPGVGLFRFPSRALFLPALAVAVLAGLGVDGVTRTVQQQLARMRSVLWASYAGLAALIVLVVLVACLRPIPVPAPMENVTRLSLVLQLVFGHAAPWLWVGVVLSLAAVAVSQPRWGRIVAGVLLACITVELATFGHSILRTVPPASLRPRSAETELAETSKTGARILARQQAVSDREAEWLGAHKVEGYDPIPLTRTLVFMEAVGLDSSAIQGLFGIKVIDLSGASKTLIDLLGVRSAALLEKDKVPDRFGWRTVKTQKVPEMVALRGVTPRLLDCRIVENPTSLPRAFVVGEARTLKSGEDRKAALASLDPRREVLLERDVLPPGARQDFTPARIVKDTPNRVELEVETTRPGYLVLTDAWYPGWHATVDTYPTIVHTAHVAFRAVALPSAGKHRVTFEYHPAGLLGGVCISGFALLLVVGAFASDFAEPVDDDKAEVEEAGEPVATDAEVGESDSAS